MQIADCKQRTTQVFNSQHALTHLAMDSFWACVGQGADRCLCCSSELHEQQWR